jgi:cytochrome c-type biogenesis protein CcmH
MATTTIATRRTPRTGHKRLNLLWAAIVVTAVFALVAGSGALSGGGAKPTSLYQRTLAVAGEYRCPVCQGETVAASQAPEAVEIKTLIGQWLGEGRSQAQIRSYLLADYGSSILEKPPASGVGAVLWLLPVLVVALAVGGLGFAFSRWRRAGSAGGRLSVAATLPGTIGAPVGSVSSILLDPEPTPVLEPPPMIDSPPVPIVAHAADVTGRRRPGLSERGRRRYRRATLAGGVALMVLAGALWLLDRAASPRLPGDTVSGGVTGITAELQQASTLAATDPAGALTLYNEVLAADPTQPVALTVEGWMYVEAGSVTKGMALLDRAEAAHPAYAPAHFYRGATLLDYEGKPAQAAAEMKWYLAHNPDPAVKTEAKDALTLAQAEVRAQARGAPTR